jgi:hypothetical protein
MGIVFCVLAALGYANRRHRRRLTVLGVAAILTFFLARPPQVQAQGLLGIINTVMNTINTTIGNWLTAIHGIQNDIRQLQQVTVWPQQMIQQARGWALSWINSYKIPMQQLFSYRTASATFTHALQLEQVLTDANSAHLPVLQNRYQQLYGPVPAATQMKPSDRNMTDIDDALAVDTLAQLQRGDQVNDAIRASGDELEQLSATAAPGTSPFVTATALVTMLKSQAVTQKMLAAYLRQISAQLAHRTALDKQAVQSTLDLHDSMTNTLGR